MNRFLVVVKEILCSIRGKTQEQLFPWVGLEFGITITTGTTPNTTDKVLSSGKCILLKMFTASLPSGMLLKGNFSPPFWYFTPVLAQSTLIPVPVYIFFFGFVRPFGHPYNVHLLLNRVTMMSYIVLSLYCCHWMLYHRCFLLLLFLPLVGFFC